MEQIVSFPSRIQETNPAEESVWRSIAGFNIPAHDTQVIDETNTPTVVITYKKNNVVVATKTISVSGAITTISVS